MSAPPVLRRLKKRKRSSEVSMKAVLSSLKSGVSVLRTAQEHGAPRTYTQEWVVVKSGTMETEMEMEIERTLNIFH